MRSGEFWTVLAESLCFDCNPSWEVKCRFSAHSKKSVLQKLQVGTGETTHPLRASLHLQYIWLPKTQNVKILVTCTKEKRGLLSVLTQIQSLQTCSTVCWDDDSVSSPRSRSKPGGRCLQSQQNIHTYKKKTFKNKERWTMWLWV